MEIYYNNEKIQIDEGVSILEVVSSYEDVEHKAVWLNGKHLMLDEFSYILRPLDRLKVVRIRGGG
ncbi:sulfur carrier protein ThiS [Acidaminobacter sp. JC074]|uniref:hypothetical protein n=1 Tax=Acidaminobacter sp. JC074 TaxID=2530199 RepID=UPI001F106F59|nr:hypothetical protein [Acidaminobacter sp. JC074]MCH4888562.1 sulfur carrier protein ThiS [Acidaminobacter sp. JC074]